MAPEGILDGNHVPDMTHKVPLVVCITRLVPQKGLHLISHAIKRIEELVSIRYSIFHKECCLSLSESNMMEMRISVRVYHRTNFYINSFCFYTVIE